MPQSARSGVSSMAQKTLFVAVVVVFGASLCKADNFKFGFTRSKDWGWPGSCVDYSIKVTIPETTPLKLKVKSSFNQSAVVRIKQLKVKSLTCEGNTGSPTPVVTSREGNLNKIDTSIIDLGDVTVEPGSTCVVDFSAKLQLLDHPSLTHGETLWQSIGVEYLNMSVWAAQQAYRVMVAPATRPNLDITVQPMQAYTSDVIVGPNVVYHVKLAHNCESSAVAETSEIVLDIPDKLVYASFAANSGSLAVTKESSPATQLKFSAGLMNFTDVVDFNITFTFDSARSLADSKLHSFAVYVNLKYTSNTCSSPDKTFTGRVGPAPSWLFYSPATTCDDASGPTGNPTMSASSHASDGDPGRSLIVAGRGDVWKPKAGYKKDKNQYLQAKFPSRVKITRITTQGFGYANGTDVCYVKSLRLYYSDNGVDWKAYKIGSKYKTFNANKDGLKKTEIPLERHIEATYIRINPQDMMNEICLRVQIHGCTSSSPLPAFPAIPNRSVLVHGTNVYICNCWMSKDASDSCCYFTTDRGATWNNVDFRVKHVAFVDPTTNQVYGLGSKTAYLRNKAGKWQTITMATYDTAKALSTSVHGKSADHLGNYEGMPANPETADRLTASDSSIWGGGYWLDPPLIRRSHWSRNTHVSGYREHLGAKGFLALQRSCCLSVG
ncbi:uncharacterized protein LOC5509253 isoform X1 [Nematostella vectensis]|uniref:uncharacterized protein LOC5509253 isoform X1 n=1 Tax=Nematostella vectensis TaxID=45351 RepID=UPI0020774D02|nr:uncharacterized protein LOC5509253 isoform X1 [Nematostella vectensis]